MFYEYIGQLYPNLYFENGPLQWYYWKLNTYLEVKLSQVIRATSGQGEQIQILRICRSYSILWLRGFGTRFFLYKKTFYKNLSLKNP